MEESNSQKEAKMFQTQFNKLTIKAHEYTQARDLHSAALHIEDKGQSLCGTTTSALYGTKSVTVEDVLMNTLDEQQSGWHWCVACASRFTGESPEFFVKSRYIMC
jgi:hypothetical protein